MYVELALLGGHAVVCLRDYVLPYPAAYPMPGIAPADALLVILTSDYLGPYS